MKKRNFSAEFKRESAQLVVDVSASDIGVRLENGKHPTLRLFVVRFDIDTA
ncbi:hypothetical protein ISC94_004731 [Escherichia coli]|nr:hypothetical protein [Escherichia coli]MBS9009115.1 hypothetical protein [Escherichia coli]